MNTTRLGAMSVAGAVLALAAVASPAAADGCGWGGGWGGGFGISYSSGWDGGCFSIGVSTPIYAYGGYGYGGCGPSYGGYYRGYGGYGGYYGGYGGYGGYYNNCGPRYYRPSYRHYYRPRYYNNCSPYYWSGGYAIEGYYVTSAGEDNVVRFRNDTYAGDPSFEPAGGFKVVRNRTDIQQAEDLDPQWAGGALAMLRKGQASEAIVALEQAAYPETFGVEPALFEPQAGAQSGPQPDEPATIVSDMGGGPAATPAQPAAAAGNPEAIRMLGLAMIADGQIDEGAAKIVEAYSLDPTLASSPIDERLFPSSARFDVRDLIRKVSVRANRTNAPEAWFALGVLMQAESRDSVALDMVLKASAQGMDQAIISPMADALRRVVYGRG